MPAEQSVHGVLEAPASLNVPAAHTVEVDDAGGQYEPAGQVTHDDAAVALVAAEYVPPAQLVGTVSAAESQYVPEGHGMQAERA